MPFLLVEEEMVAFLMLEGDKQPVLPLEGEKEPILPMEGEKEVFSPVQGEMEERLYRRKWEVVMEVQAEQEGVVLVAWLLEEVRVEEQGLLVG